MAATPRTSLPITANGVNGVIPVSVVYDTAGSGMEIYAAQAGKMIAVVGWLGVDSTSTEGGFGSAANYDHTLELAANQGAIMPIGNPVFVTQPGEALNWKGSGAFTKATFYIQVSDKFNVGSPV